ncbi:MAG: membrane protein insertion efficiency factor YidD [Synechococcaceae cyanobacterium RL_1_2]|nr:membrane protein insertion efficiency factor YidD [Synechococcaceae cyanobacterium RL_1_2]
MGNAFHGDRILTHSTLWLVKFYQRQISPHKGFSCAHRRLYGGLSCSEYFRRSLQTQGLSDALPLFKHRLLDCKRANYLISAYRQQRSNINEQQILGQERLWNHGAINAIDGSEEGESDQEVEEPTEKNQKPSKGNKWPRSVHYEPWSDTSWCLMCDLGDVWEGFSICDGDCNGIPDCLEPGFNLVGGCDSCACDCS